MTGKEPEKVVGIPIWGIFLTFSGVILLLQNLNVPSLGLRGSL